MLKLYNYFYLIDASTWKYTKNEELIYFEFFLSIFQLNKLVYIKMYAIN